jgi:hypothetical protein
MTVKNLPEPRLYTDLAEWWPLLSPPSEYPEEAAELIAILKDATTPPPRTLLELGAGGGSLAFHLKGAFTLTLTDRSPGMLAVSRAVNPECEHLEGDMRTLRLNRTFDGVLIHDAVMYAADRDELLATLLTAAAHCRAGGAVVILPDHVTETFRAGTECGGHDAPDGRGLRYLEWVWDPDPLDTSFEVAYAFLLRDTNGTTTAEADRHRCGLFRRDAWMGLLREGGFRPRVLDGSFGRSVFVGVREG